MPKTRWTFSHIFNMKILITKSSEINSKYDVLKENINNCSNYKQELPNSYIVIDIIKQKIKNKLF